MKKRLLIIAILIIFILIVTGLITNYIDTARVSSGHEPKCCIKIISYDGSKVTYWGLGYKVIRYVGVSPKEPYESNIGVKMGNWFMKYELPIDSEYNDKNEDINSLDDFYSTKLTINNDIRNLSKDYSMFDAIKDNGFYIGAMVHNDNLYNEFMEKYKNKQTAFIRVATSTVEGDLILYDILYYDNTDKLYLVTDNTRDEFAEPMDRSIKLREFDAITEYGYGNNLYWVLYNGKLDDNSFNSDNTFVIATIN